MSRRVPRVGALVLVLAGSAASAQQRERPFFQASRALAMGDAFTAYDIGYESVYYNPAGVARKGKYQVKYVDLEGVVSQGVFSVITGTFSNLLDMGNIVQRVFENQGKVQSLGFSLAPQFLAKNISFGVLARSYNEAYIDPTTTDMDFYATTDLAAYLHFGVSLFGGIVKIGAGAKVLDRAEVNRTYTQAEYAGGGLSFQNEWQEGLGFGYDAGVLLTFPSRLQPSLGVSVQEIGNTTLTEQHNIFSGSSAADGAPPALRQRLNVGLGMATKPGKGIKMGFGLEMKDILRSGDYVERIHGGVEMGINNILFLRGGVNQGIYWTAGLGLHAGGIGLEIATYGENLKIGMGSRRDDRKWVGRYVIAF